MTSNALKNWRPAGLLAIAVMLSITLTGCEQSAQPSADLNAPRPVSESLFAATAELRASQLSNVSYDLTVNLDKQSDSFSGVTQITFDLVPNNQSDLTIDFDKGVVHSISRNGQPVNFDYEKWFITIPASELAAGSNTLVIDYQHPYATDGSGLHRFVDPEDGETYLYTDFEPYDAHRLFPHFDQPDLKATYTLQVTAPASWQVVSSTRETAIAKDGDNQVWTFPTSAKFSSYVFSMHAGPYVVREDQFEDIPLRLFVRKSLQQYVVTDEWFIPTKQSFGFFNRYFDVRYPFGKYDQIMVPDFNAGAMENVAAVTFSERYVERSEKSTQSKMRLANVIAHEMAHMWFGDLVTMRWWNGLWLNESFATYMANLAISEASDFENSWDVFYSGTKQWAYRTDDSVNTHAIELPVASTGDAMTNFDGITYGKGASVLKQLPYYLGEENFRLGVSNYIKKHAYKNTDLDDFIGELGKAANRDMQQWTQDWLYEAGLNTIKVDFECNDTGISALSIAQTAPEGYPTLREQRVQIGFYQQDGDGLTLATALPIVYSGAKTDIPAAIGMACPDLVYPNEADWGYVKVALDDRSLASAQQRINGIANVTTRLMLWQSLIDSVNDANLSAASFIDFALANIRGEQDYNVARAISGGLNTALSYTDIATRDGISDYAAQYTAVEDLYLQLLSQATPGSDLQKLWYDNYLSVAKNPAHLERLTTVLAGKQTFDGLTIDQDKRWGIVAKLNRYAYGDYQAALTAEAARDMSDNGVNSAMSAEAQRPDAATKAKWFNVVTQNPDNLKQATLRYIMFYLFPAEQQALEEPFKARIKTHIEELNKGSDLTLIRSFAGSMLPVQCNAASEQELAGLVEEYSAMKPQVVKAVKAAHQQAERCIKVVALL